MKSQVLRISLLSALLVAGAWAQLARPVTAEIPFDFTAGKTTFAAGEYSVNTQSPGVLRIVTADGKQSAMLLFSPKRARDLQAQTKLIFNRYGNRYFLSQVWMAGTETGIELRKTAAEVEIARQVLDSDNAAVVARKRQ